MNVGRGKTVRLYTLERAENRQIGKIVPYGNQLVYASTFSAEHTKHKDGNRLGINMAVLEFCRKNGIDRFIVVDSKGILPMSMYQPFAYLTQYEKFRKFGVVGKGGKWGTIINLPDRHWTQMAVPKLPFIADPAAFVPVYATSESWQVAA